MYPNYVCGIYCGSKLAGRLVDSGTVSHNNVLTSPIKPGDFMNADVVYGATVLGRFLKIAGQALRSAMTDTFVSGEIN